MARSGGFGPETREEWAEAIASVTAALKRCTSDWRSSLVASRWAWDVVGESQGSVRLWTWSGMSLRFIGDKGVHNFTGVFEKFLKREPQASCIYLVSRISENIWKASSPAPGIFSCAVWRTAG